MTTELPMLMEGSRPRVQALGMEAFTALVRAHQGMVFGIAYHCLRDAAAAEDVAQEAFFRLSRSLHKLRSPEHVVFWLRQVTARLCIDAMRKARPAASLEVIPEPALHPGHEDPLLNERLRHLVAELSPAARLAVVMRYQEDLEPSEIAELLEESVHTVKSRLQRALATLRGRLEQLGGGRP